MKYMVLKSKSTKGIDKIKKVLAVFKIRENWLKEDL